MISRHVALVPVVGAFLGCAASTSALATEPVPSFTPAISEDARAAVLRMGETLLAQEYSFTARIIRVYLDEFGQPLHIFHTMNIAVRRPDRLAVRVTGDDGSHDLYYDGKSVSIFSPESKVFAVLPASGDTSAALDEVLDQFNFDFPLINFFGAAPDEALLRGVVAGRQVGTVNVDGIESRHLFFSAWPGTDLELWVEKNGAAIPRRLIVTHRLLPGQPSFIAEFTNWDSQVHLPESAFAFQPPADAQQIDFGPAVAPVQQGSQR